MSDQGLLQRLQIPGFGVLVQHDRNLQQSLKADGQVVEALEQLIGEVQLGQLMEPAQPVVDERARDVNLLAQAEVFPEV